MSLPHKHRPLSSRNTFRVIDLQPAQTFSDPLCCRLIELDASLASLRGKTQRYEALSYVWGVPSGTCELICDDGILQITPNCESALRHLRLVSKPRKIFVDAICIDQSSEHHSVLERNQQVKLMGEIYSQAYRTLIWLGDSNDETQPAFKYLGQIGGLVRKGMGPASVGGWVTWKLRGSIVVDPKTIVDIYSRAWFGRLWTIQELALSSKETLVVCGNESILWDIFAAAGQWWSHRNQGTVLLYKSKFAPFLNQHRTRIDLMRLYPYLDPAICLNRSREHQSSKPIDKIYGVYSLLEKLGLSMPEPDYTIPVSMLCEEITVSLIQKEGVLHIFDCLRSHNRLPDLPSWVPDWTAPYLNGACVRRDIKFAKPRQIDTSLLATRQPRQLPLAGKYISNIRACDTHSGLWDPLPERPVGWLGLDWHLALVECLRSWFRFAEEQSFCVTDGGAMRAVCEAFVSYHVNSNDSYFKPRSWKVVFQQWQEATVACEAMNRIKQSSWDKWVGKWHIDWRERLSRGIDDPDFRFLYLITVNDETFWNVRLEIFLRLHRRNIFITETGHLGLGPSEVQAGDLVVLFPGALSPILLRKHGRFFLFIGPAVIHGLMGGTIRHIFNIAFSSDDDIIDRDEAGIWPATGLALDTFILV